jgi:hypothetical protein
LLLLFIKLDKNNNMVLLRFTGCHTKPTTSSRLESSLAMSRNRNIHPLALEKSLSLERRLLNDFISKYPLRRVSLLQGLAGGG